MWRDFLQTLYVRSGLKDSWLTLKSFWYELSRPFAADELQEDIERELLGLASASLTESDRLVRAEKFMRLARLYTEKDAREKAYYCLQQALELCQKANDSEKEAAVWVGIAVGHMRQNQYDEAIVMLEHALSRIPKEIIILYTYAQGLEIKKKWPEAKKVYEKILEIEPEHSKALRSLGKLLRREGRLDEALSFLEKSRELAPKDFWTLHELIEVYKRSKKYAEAKVVGEGALESTEDAEQRSWMLLELGDITRLENHWPQAQQYFEKALVLKPNWLIAQICLASVARQLNKPGEVDKYLALVAEQIEQAGLYEQACYLALKGDVDSGLNKLDYALKEDPGLRHWAWYDPDLIELRKDSRFNDLLAD